MYNFNGLHVGIIMDGNGRWAAQQGLTRYHGHRAGAKAVRSCVKAAPDLGVNILTLYAFSSDNWKRPEPEIKLLFRLFEKYLQNEIEECLANSVRLQIIGRRDRLGTALLNSIELAENETRSCSELLLRLAIDYSARHAILEAAESLCKNQATYSSGLDYNREFNRLVTQQPEDISSLQEVDLIIRTGGEKRLSDFLLWEGAYAELYFTDLMWPDFDITNLESAITDFHSRERRFGCVSVPNTNSHSLPNSILSKLITQSRVSA